ncbi:MAG: Uma2 family endonuclease [bacterium]
MSVQLQKRHFTVDDYYRMGETGILTEDDRVELLKGEIIQMTPIGSRRAACVDRLNRLLSQRFGKETIVRVQNPVRIGEDTEPQPDLMLLRIRPDFYAHAHPKPEDIFLLIEVADTSADFDREVKIPLYAQAGIPEVWLVDLPGEYVEVHSKPSATGYDNVQRMDRGQSLCPEAFAEIRLNVADMLV